MRWYILLLLVFLVGCMPLDQVQKIPYEEAAASVDYKQKIIDSQNEIIKGSEGELEVHFIDVGQGDSTFFRFPNGRTMLIDCGNNYQGDEVTDYISGLNESKIDVLIATHPDADHIGGCDYVMENMDVGYVFDNGQSKDTKSYESYIELAKQRNYKLVEKDSSLNIDGNVSVDIFVVYDEEGFMDDINDNSIVVRVVYGESSFLFTGDCGYKCEESLSLNENLDVDVLKLGHHGSRHSTTEGFILETTPGLAVISSDGGKKYGHPDNETLARLVEYGIDYVGTYDKGNIVLYSDGKNIKI